MERKTAEELRRLNRALRVLSACNQALAHATSEQQLLDKICQIIVASGDYRLAWIGYAEPDSRKTVRPMAQAGQEEGYLSAIDVTWSPDDPKGRGPMGSAIRENKLQMIADTGHDPAFAPWRSNASKRGYSSVVALPLKVAGQAFGALGIYSPRVRGFESEEIELLEELAGNLSYGITALRAQEERVLAGNALREAESRYRQLVEQVPAISYVAELGIQGRWHYVSPQIETIFGFTPEEWTSRPSAWHEQMHPDDIPKVLTAERTLVHEGDRFSLEYRMRARDGREVWVRDEAIYACANPNGSSEPVMRGLLLDITERKLAEKALQRSEQNYRMFVEQSSEGILRTEHEPPVSVSLPIEEQLEMALNHGYIAECNDALALMYGFDSASKVIGKRLVELWQTKDAAILEFSKEFVKSGYRISDFQIHTVTRAGRKTFLISLLGIVENGAVTRTWGLQRDVTERAQLEEQVRTMQQMEAVGRLAGGVAHDFNNIMGIIIGHSDLMLMEEAHPSDRAKASLIHIRRAADKAASLTQQLLAFSRKQVLQPRIMDLNETVSDVEKMLLRVLGEDIEVTSRLEPALARVKADPGQMHQVLMNLAVNARDAMPHGGKLIMETANAVIDAAYADSRPGLHAGKYAMLAVSDTGHGMDSETLAHIFEPFYTTKGPGKGTGLGLATVYGIIKQSGGHVWVYSEPEKGTTFRVYLPAEQSAAETVAGQADVQQVICGTETILLVEDESDLREIARVFLSGYGYRILDAPSAPAALNLAKQFQGTIDLLLTDVIMPGMSGRQLAEQVAALRPSIKIVYMTGYTDDMVVHHRILEPGVSVLQKPFTRQQLGAKVRTALDTASDGKSLGQSASAE